MNCHKCTIGKKPFQIQKKYDYFVFLFLYNLDFLVLNWFLTILGLKPNLEKNQSGVLTGSSKKKYLKSNVITNFELWV